MSEKPPKISEFRKYYERGSFPIAIESDSSGNKRIDWKINKDIIDYQFYLPLFFDGLTETQEPYCFLVEQGITDLLEAGGSKILPTIPQLVWPIKSNNNF